MLASCLVFSPIIAFRRSCLYPFLIEAMNNVIGHDLRMVLLLNWAKKEGMSFRHTLLYRRALRGLDYALGHHGIGYLDEASHVGTLHVIDVAVGACAILHA